MNALVTPAEVTQKSDELLIGPITTTVPVQGVPVNLVSSTFLTLHTTNTGLILKARVTTDLHDLQNKIGAIIDTISLPRDNCASYKPANPVVTIWGKELKASEHGATLWLHGKVEIWSCVQNPIPQTKVEIHGLSVTVRTWPGNPFKNLSATQPFDISEPFNVTKVNDSTVALTLGDPNVQLGGQFVFIANGILRIAGVDINEKAKDALRGAVDPNKLQFSVPPEYLALNPKVEDVGLSTNGANLIAVLNLSANVPAAQINETLLALLGKMKPKS
jgi:hypothetical protein